MIDIDFGEVRRKLAELWAVLGNRIHVRNADRFYEAVECLMHKIHTTF